MSDITAPTAPAAKSTSTIIWLSVVALVVAIGLIWLLPSPADYGKGVATADAELGVATRIQKVGTVAIRQAARALQNGEAVYKAQCAACHASGVAGAPKFQDAAAWAPRIAQGYDTLVQSALKGKGNMGPQGGGDFSDLEIGRAVAFIGNAAGAKFEEPAAPAGAASAAEGESAPAA